MADYFNSLKIISLNVNGIRDITKRKSIFIFCRRKNADLILLQETHSVDSDVKFWKTQWGDQGYFCHFSQQSAGVAILLNKFSGDIIESCMSDEGRWIILILKMNNSCFIVCNLYSYNYPAQAKTMCTQLCEKLIAFQNKYKEAHLIVGGDFNDTPNDLIDRIPARTTQSSRFKSTTFISERLSVVDIWRFLNPDKKEFTWSNANRSLQSRIDLWFISPSCTQFVSETSHEYAPLSDHNLIIIHLTGSKQKTNNLRGYWKLNINLIKDEIFCNLVNKTAKKIFINNKSSPTQKWEYFKFKTRELAIRRGKEIKKINLAKEDSIMNELHSLLLKASLSEEEQIKMKSLKVEIDNLYINMAKGAFVRSRAKWLEQGEKNSSYFFALEKRNRKRNNIVSLKINDNITNNPSDISKYVYSFYSNIYKSNFNINDCEKFITLIKSFTPSISEQFQQTCEEPITKLEILEAIKSMSKGKSPGIDGIPVEFYLHFWNIIETPLMELFCECLDKKELSTTMKQGLITLIPKPEKDHLLIENWRPITLLNCDYKIFSLIFAKRLKRGLNEIIGETQTGFMTNRHISSNIRLVLDLLDYSDYIESEALVVFLDFYKAFDTVEHNFLYNALQIFGFGQNFVSTVEMFYKNINSSVLLYPHTTQRFPVMRSVRQGCPISPFLFLIVVELLSLNILHDPVLKGLSMFGKEIRITQLADDTALFLRDKHQIEHAVSLVDSFSAASGLKLNKSKCEIFCLSHSEDKILYNMPVKTCVKYLGIHVCKDPTERQLLNFSSKLQKTKCMLNMWLQRDLSIIGRILLSKAEGVSRLVYPALSLTVPDSTSKDINNIFINFVWKNKHHYLKKEVLSGSREEGGFELLDFKDLNYTFKLKWVKECLKAPHSLWFFIPHNIFKAVGGLHFLLRCNYNVSKLPLRLSKFYQQALLVWK